MTNPIHEPYNAKNLRDGIASGNGYTFTFQTANPMDLNITNMTGIGPGVRYDLTVLRTMRPASNATAAVRTLYHASTLIDHLWVQFDHGTQEIIGTWPGV